MPRTLVSKPRVTLHECFNVAIFQIKWCSYLKVNVKDIYWAFPGMNKTFHIKWVFIQQGSIVLLTVLLQFYGKVMKTNFENQKPNIICHRKQFQQTLLQSLKYRKRSCISRTFFHKIEAKTQGCGLSTDRCVFEVLKNLINIHTTSQDSQCQETYKNLECVAVVQWVFYE